MANVLLVDDDANFAAAMRGILGTEGHEVDTAASLSEARERLAAARYDVQIVDITLPDGNGLDLVDERGPRTVIITGHPSVETAISAVRGGQVIDYLVKPLDKTELVRAIEASGDSGKGNGESEATDDMVGDSTAMRSLRTTIGRYGPTDITVLITGESGTGKDLVARALHRARGGKGRFVAVNCGAIPADLIASELFGHEKGSFTGAAAKRQGIFERAAGGTVFLDEVGELPHEQQVALLRVLESRRLTRVGGERDIHVDVRVVAATNSNLEEAVAAGEFRKDLYYRLMILPIGVPPLRDRLADLEALSRHFLREFAAEYGTPAEIDDQLLEQMRAYAWPGNIRELRHVLLRAAIPFVGADKVSELPPDFGKSIEGRCGSGELYVGMSISDAERQLIEKTLAHFDGHRKRTAKALGISLKTLYNRLSEYQQENGNGATS